MKIEDLGQLVVTRGVADLQESNKGFARFTQMCLGKYINEDWGDLSIEDEKMNDRAVKSGSDRILASYSFPPNAPWEAVGGWKTKEDKLWIITEWDRSVTTILFPGEY